jgi:hypothetical protein
VKLIGKYQLGARANATRSPLGMFYCPKVSVAAI